MKFFFLAVLFLASNSGAHAQGWLELGSAGCSLKPNGDIVTICADSGAIVFAAGQFTDSLSDTSGRAYVAQWDGSCWTRLGGSVFTGLPGEISTMCVDRDHNIYVAGGFKNLADDFFVSKWDGVTWSELGTGSNSLRANSYISSICSDPFGNLFAAGQFTDAGGYAYVAKWNGVSWDSLGTAAELGAMPGSIYSICADRHGNIYAVGDIEDSGYYYVAKWNGSTWSKLGAGGNRLAADFLINKVAADTADNIYASGYFTDGSGKVYVAKWDGVEWTELGTGANALNTHALVSYVYTDKRGNVYTQVALSNGATDIARWNGTSWTQLGVGYFGLNANSTVWTLCADDADNIYAAGSFTDSNNYQKGYRYVAQYQVSKESLVHPEQDIVHVYPNPAENTIVINCAVCSNDGYQIYNALGTMVKSGPLTGNTTEIDVSKLAPQLYVVKIIGIVTSYQKIIKK